MKRFMLRTMIVVTLELAVTAPPALAQVKIPVLLDCDIGEDNRESQTCVGGFLERQRRCISKPRVAYSQPWVNRGVSNQP